MFKMNLFRRLKNATSIRRKLHSCEYTVIKFHDVYIDNKQSYNVNVSTYYTMFTIHVTKLTHLPMCIKVNLRDTKRPTKKKKKNKRQ